MSIIDAQRLIEAIDAWCFETGSLSDVASAMQVKLDYVREILLNAGLSTTNDTAWPSTTFNTVAFTILLHGLLRCAGRLDNLEEQRGRKRTT